MNEELLCPVCQHPISHHSDSYLAGCNEKLDTNPNRFCICYETRTTIQLRANLDIAVEALNKIVAHDYAGMGYRECADIHDAIIVIAKDALKKLEE